MKFLKENLQKISTGIYILSLLLAPYFTSNLKGRDLNGFIVIFFMMMISKTLADIDYDTQQGKNVKFSYVLLVILISVVVMSSVKWIIV